MRLTREQIELMAFNMVRNLLQEGKIEVDDRDKLIDRLTQVVTSELLIEDKVNDEVREILNRHSDEIRSGNIEYQTMFKMVKDKLVRERKLIL